MGTNQSTQTEILVLQGYVTDCQTKISASRATKLKNKCKWCKHSKQSFTKVHRLTCEKWQKVFIIVKVKSRISTSWRIILRWKSSLKDYITARVVTLISKHISNSFITSTLFYLKRGDTAERWWRFILEHLKDDNIFEAAHCGL